MKAIITPRLDAPIRWPAMEGVRMCRAAQLRCPAPLAASGSRHPGRTDAPGPSLPETAITDGGL